MNEWLRARIAASISMFEIAPVAVGVAVAAAGWYTRTKLFAISPEQPVVLARVRSPSTMMSLSAPIVRSAP